MSVALAMIVRNEGRLLPENVDYHAWAGVTHFYLCDDGCEDDGIDRVRERPGVVVQKSLDLELPTDPALAHFVKIFEADFTARQAIHAWAALHEARKAGCDWLITIDADELIHLPDVPLEEGWLGTALFPYRATTDMIHFETLEVLQRSFAQAQPFTGETLFKRIASNRIRKSLLNPYTGQSLNYSRFYGHQLGKVAVRTDRLVAPMSSHAFRSLGLSLRVQHLGFVLHFRYYDFQDFLKNLRNFRDYPDHYLFIGPARRLFRDVVNDPAYSDQCVADFYRQNVMFSPSEVAALPEEVLAEVADVRMRFAAMAQTREGAGDHQQVQTKSPQTATGVSCVCVSHGHFGELDETIRSFLDQDYQGPKELIILCDPGLPRLVHPELVYLSPLTELRTAGERLNAAYGLARYDVHFCWRDDEIHSVGRISHSLARLGPQGKVYHPGLCWMPEHEQVLSPCSQPSMANGCWTREIFLEVGGYPARDADLDGGLAKRFRERLCPIGARPSGSNDVLTTRRHTMSERRPGPSPQTLDSLLHILDASEAGSPFAGAIQEMLEKELQGKPAAIPQPGGPRPRSLLTIGMAVYEDFDGAYFTLQAIRLYHSEILDEVEFLLLDNNPTGRCANHLKTLGDSIPNFRYVPQTGYNSTAVRDLLFRTANSDFVISVDSHVYFAPGALAQLLSYLKAHPDTNDLLQGPLVYDDLKTYSTHMEEKWRQGFWGVWSPLLTELPIEPFDIPSHGLGVFCCRVSAWPGFHPHMRGFGGEEGCLHRRFRQNGGRTLCLPFLGWMHRFNRPFGLPYAVTTHDRVRNYLLLFDNLGIDRQILVEGMRQLSGSDDYFDSVAQDVYREMESPLFGYAAAVCVHAEGEWENILDSLQGHPLRWILRSVPVPEVALEPAVGRSMAFRQVAEQVHLNPGETVLLIAVDACPPAQAWLDLEEAYRAQRHQSFRLQEERYELQARVLDDQACQALLAAIPPGGLAAARWLRSGGDLEALLG